MARLMLLSVLLLVSCSPKLAPGESDAGSFEMVRMSSLPQLVGNYTSEDLKLEVAFLVKSDGSIQRVRLLSSSGDPEWDASAIDSMLSWKFAPVIYDEETEARWVKNTIVVQFYQPVFMSVGEIRARSKSEADSIYKLIRGGSDFETLAKEAAASEETATPWYFELVDISVYPEHIRNELFMLKNGAYTRPLRNGPVYVIFKRFE